MSNITPFASIDARINRRVQARLANATLSFAGGVEQGVIYDIEQATTAFDDMVTAARHLVSLNVADFPGITEGSVVTLNGAAHRVAAAVVPDSSGWASFPVTPVPLGRGG